MLLSISNKVEVDRQLKTNRRMFWGGIAALLASMVTLLITSSDASLIAIVFVVGYPLLAAGLVLSKRSSFNSRRHGVGGYKLRSESDMIAEELAGFSTRYHLYNWVKLGDTMVEHLLVTPLGVMIVLMKSHGGDIKAGHDHYRRKLGPAGWFAVLGEPGIGKPSLELATQVKKVRAWFEEKGFEVPTDGIVVFSSPRSKIIGAEEMSFPVCHLHDLPLALKGWETELNMTSAEQQQIENLVIEALPTAIAEEARALSQMPGYKRAALLKAKETPVKDKKVKAKEAAKPLEIAAPKPKLTPEERETLRLERIKAQQEKGRNPVNPNAPLAPGKRMGMNGKIIEDKPKVVEKKIRRQVEPLHKPTAGAFGDISAAGNKKK